uniref:DUF3778 domain-containing protein n=1 Tax=Oryza glumipatula TaxID=40148 RepID=A0A0D9Y8J5_9ORYZ
MEVGDGGGVADVARLGDGDAITTEDDGGGADPGCGDGGGSGCSDAAHGSGGGSNAAHGDGGCTDAARGCAVTASGGDDCAVVAYVGVGGVSLVLLLHLVQVCSSPTLCYREHLSMVVLFTASGGIHAGCAIRVELKLLRFNGELRGEVWLSPVKLTPKSTAQQQISNLCSFCGGDRRGLTVRQAVCMLKETQGCNRRGFAAAPCRFAPSALPSFRRLFVFLIQFSILYSVHLAVSVDDVRGLALLICCSNICV